MRKLYGILAASLLAVGIAGSSSAVVLNAQGAAGLQVSTLAPILFPGLLDVTVNASGGGIGSHIDQLQLPASPFATTSFAVDVTDPAAAPIEGLLATVHNNDISVSGDPLVGLGGLSGVVKVCLFAECTSAVVPANLSVPVDVVGAGGSAFVAGFVNVTVIGAPWTSGTANVGFVTANGFAHGPASNTSSTAAPSGVVSLVTPIFISTSIPGSSVIPGFGLLQIHIVPEPGTLLLLGSGMLGLALVGRRKLRR